MSATKSKRMKVEFMKASIPRIIQQLLTYAASMNDDKKYVLEVKERKQHRSLNANNYYWALLTELAAALNISKEEAHLEMLKSYGTTLTTPDGEAVIISSQTELAEAKAGIYCSFIGTGTTNGKTFFHYRVIKGSHEYDSREMSTLINGLVSECRELGIETMTDLEISRLKYE